MRYIAMAALVVAAWVGSSLAQIGPGAERESLRGLPGVGIHIEEVSQTAQADGLSKAALQAAVERILRSNGIRILTGEERKQTASAPYLYVNVDTFKREGEYVFGITVSLEQMVKLIHIPKEMVVSTWSISSTGSVGIRDVADIIPRGIEPKIKAFAKDFLAVNPR